MLIDSHCHLQDPAFDADRQEVYQRAREAEVSLIIPGYSLESSQAAVQLTRRFKSTWAQVGIHPHEVRNLPDAWLTELDHLANDERVVAVGEIGLDYYRDLSPRALQRQAFEAQLAFAVRRQLPVSVHSRDAEADTVAMLRAARGVSGVLHCFTGSRQMAEALLELGFYLSFAGPVTFKNGQALRDLVRWAPLDRLLVETDAPYMAPTPMRGRRNEPQWVVYTARAIADEINRSPIEVNQILVSNTIKAFSRLIGNDADQERDGANSVDETENGW